MAVKRAVHLIVFVISCLAMQMFVLCQTKSDKFTSLLGYHFFVVQISMLHLYLWGINIKCFCFETMMWLYIVHF